MIGQYLSNTNESATVYEAKNFYELNKALVTKKRIQIFSDFPSHQILRYMNEILNIGKKDN